MKDKKAGQKLDKKAGQKLDKKGGQDAEQNDEKRKVDSHNSSDSYAADGTAAELGRRRRHG
jgi:hypothetical protein